MNEPYPNLQNLSEFWGPLLAKEANNIANQNSNVLIYPNPTENRIRIEGTENIQQIAIINTIGQIILVVKNNNESIMEIDLSRFSNGLYLLRMRDEKENLIMKRIVKN